ncbi:ubiquitin carboxyl-terminal hydrolase 44-like [Gigantopelta aegis]|uniref:ubiquitin carboxyl-terminal hydrolase 44-like n=1 Tax=Gigantopelta aegis TaxID=1735272 RepID=UPI001B888217|nr:ubiquitin carboxyl-terminal hydrolase 44-like [Gigantopelta aegis]XP_041365137.1 ubiquitin carboxyl-terminal hydrolase 44-like [Gigantopelta aegis]XP_041365138.1 ubiquitin carboxyl-terminal hydrolase 44-like [Gigantopelta aegis]
MDHCQHLKSHLAENPSFLNPEKWMCAVCGTTESVWACLSCSHVACGRFSEGHALNHFTQTKHPIALELNEKYVYCYVCDEYILSDNMDGDLSLLRRAIHAIAAQSFDEMESRGQRLLQNYSYSEMQNRTNADEIDKLATADCHYRKSLLQKAFSAWFHCVLQEKADESVQTEVTPIKKARLDGLSPSPVSLASPSLRRRTLIPGVTGLRNLGNTCYLNSILQSLGHIEKFRQFFLHLQFYSGLSPPVTPVRSSLMPRFTQTCTSPVTDGDRGPSSTHNRTYRRLNTMDCFQHLCSEMASTPDSKKMCVGGLSGGGNPSTSISLDTSGDHGDFMSLCQELHGLFRVMWSGKWAQVSPHAFLQAVWNFIPTFKGHFQHDAQEFLCELLDKVSDELRTVRDLQSQPPVVEDTFQGELISTVTCLECNRESTTREPFMDLSLEFPKRYQITSPDAKLSTETCHITEILEHFTDIEILDGKIYGCEYCNRRRKKTVYTSAHKQLLINELPLVLRLHLKRFRWSGRNHREKISTHVEFDDLLNMSTFCSDNVPESECCYKLTAVVIHHGRGFGSGHYTAYCWNSEADSWIYCNDSKVELCSLKDVLQSQAYILLYTKDLDPLPSSSPSSSSMEGLQCSYLEPETDSQVIDEDITFVFHPPSQARSRMLENTPSSSSEGSKDTAVSVKCRRCLTV